MEGVGEHALLASFCSLSNRRRLSASKSSCCLKSLNWVRRGLCCCCCCWLRECCCKRGERASSGESLYKERGSKRGSCKFIGRGWNGWKVVGGGLGGEVEVEEEVGEVADSVEMFSGEGERDEEIFNGREYGVGWGNVRG